MRAEELLTIGDCVLKEGPESPAQAVNAFQRMALKIDIEDLERKGANFLHKSSQLQVDLKRLEKEAREGLADSEIDF